MRPVRKKTFPGSALSLPGCSPREEAGGRATGSRSTLPVEVGVALPSPGRWEFRTEQEETAYEFTKTQGHA